MKKAIFTQVLMMAIMAVVSMTMLTACGGDDADSGGKESGGGTSTTFKYIVPYTQWNASSTKVASDMESIGWYKESESEKYSGIFSVTYSAPDESAASVFTFSGDKLQSTILAYNGYTEKNFQTLLSETKKTYGVTLELSEASTSEETLFTGRATINGRTSYIGVGCLKVGSLQMYVVISQ